DNLLIPCEQCPPCRNIFSLNFEGFNFAVPIPPHNNKLDEAIDLTNEVISMKKSEPFKIISSSASTNIPIAITREIKKKLSRRAPKGIKRAVLFYQMEKMRTASADALLKMIEEPPGDTVVILITNKPDSLLPTIQSRAQKVKVGLNPPEVIEKYLIDKYDISGNKAKLLSKIAESSIGRAINMIETAVDDSASKRAVIFLLFKSLVMDNNPETLAHMNEVWNFRDRSEAEELLRLWQSLIRDCANFAVLNDEEEIINIDFVTDIKKIANNFKSPQLALEMVNNIKITLADLRLNVHIQGALMALAMKLKSNIKRLNNCLFV
ncbi:MAG: hypothetical protein ACE5D6_10195, partial [Candidatus Zixiibacteriota bacterium]